MKKTLLTVLLVALMAVPCFAQVASHDWDIDIPQPKKDVEQLDTIIIRRFSQTVEVESRYKLEDGSYRGGETYTFINVPEEVREVCDDAEPPNCKDVVVQEADPKFTQFINFIETRIGAGDSLLVAVKKAVNLVYPH